MRPPRNPTWLSWFAKASLAFVAIVVFASGSAHAGCGDYLTPAAHADSSATPRAMPDSVRDRQSVLPVGPYPCSGPSCSQRNSEPLNVPVTPVQVSVEQWGWVSRSPVFRGPDHAFWLVQLASAVPIHNSDCIFHPPRPTRLFSY